MLPRLGHVRQTWNHAVDNYPRENVLASLAEPAKKSGRTQAGFAPAHSHKWSKWWESHPQPFAPEANATTLELHLVEMVGHHGVAPCLFRPRRNVLLKHL